MFCRGCGKEMEDYSNYCSRCGIALSVRAETATLDRIGSYKTDPRYATHANRKEMPVKGSLSIIPLFGVMGLKFMVISFMVTLYGYNLPEMEQLVNGINVMPVLIICALLSVLFSLAGVLSNIKNPVEGRVVFFLSFFFSLVTTVLAYITFILNSINNIMIISITSSTFALLMFLIESQRIKTFMAAYTYGAAHKRPTGKPSRDKEG